MGKYLVFLLLLTSCANPKKLHRMMDKLPFHAADECAQRFPIKERIDTLMVEDTALINAYLNEYHYMSQMIDSLLDAKCDTLYVDKIREKIKQIPCKPQIKYIIKTQESTAKLKVLQMECDKKQAELLATNNKIAADCNALKDRNVKLKHRINLLLLIIVFLAGWVLRKPILKIIK
jgi:hypothetical protein